MAKPSTGPREIARRFPTAAPRLTPQCTNPRRCPPAPGRARASQTNTPPSPAPPRPLPPNTGPAFPADCSSRPADFQISASPQKCMTQLGVSQAQVILRADCSTFSLPPPLDNISPTCIVTSSSSRVTHKPEGASGLPGTRDSRPHCARVRSTCLAPPDRWPLALQPSRSVLAPYPFTDQETPVSLHHRCTRLR